jgi:hypothetical protein
VLLKMVLLRKTWTWDCPRLPSVSLFSVGWGTVLRAQLLFPVQVPMQIASLVVSIIILYLLHRKARENYSAEWMDRLMAMIY